jgi:ribosome biogenesis ATPase
MAKRPLTSALDARVRDVALGLGWPVATADAVLDALRARFREYDRVKHVVLRKQVVMALERMSVPAKEDEGARTEAQHRAKRARADEADGSAGALMNAGLYLHRRAPAAAPTSDAPSIASGQSSSDGSEASSGSEDEDDDGSDDEDGDSEGAPSPSGDVAMEGDADDADDSDEAPSSARRVGASITPGRDAARAAPAGAAAAAPATPASLSLSTGAAARRRPGPVPVLPAASSSQRRGPAAGAEAASVRSARSALSASLSARARGARPAPDHAGGPVPSSAAFSSAAGAAASGGAAPDGEGAGWERPSARLRDLGGVEGALRDVRELIEYPLTHPEIYAHLGVEPPKGVLLHGPPGCGKTLLALAVAGELGVYFRRISAPELVSGMTGGSEEKLRALFDDAVARAPALIFLDEIDAIAPKRETSQRGMERRMVAQLLTCMDALTLERTAGRAVLVIGATNRPDALDPALRRAGRFDREIALGIPDEAARVRILTVLSRRMRVAGEVDFGALARMTPGYVGADLEALTKEAAVLAVNRVFLTLFARSDAPEKAGHDALWEEFERVSAALRTSGPLSAEQLAPLAVSFADFCAAVKKVQPSATREGFATIPDVSWDDVGALGGVREELEMAIVEPIRHPERYAALGLRAPAGVLLFGPPGCGKTLVAKAVANESRANFISIKGPELLDKYVGESERAVRQVFQRARASAPCVVFFDELDALAPRRGADGGSAGVSERVVNQLLTELDGLDARRDVFVVAATNRPDIIDPAMLRPGRLDKLLYVPLPTAEGRAAILRTLLRRTPAAADVDVDLLAKDVRSERYSGADLAGLVREAALCTLREDRAGGAWEVGAPAPTEPLRVAHRHFEAAWPKVRASVGQQDQRQYDSMTARLRVSRSHVDSGAVGGAAPSAGPSDGPGVAPA